MVRHAWLLPRIVVIVAVKVKITIRRRSGGAGPATGRPFPSDHPYWLAHTIRCIHATSVRSNV